MKSFNFKTWLMLVMLLVGVGTIWGADATFTFSTQGYTNAQVVTSGTLDTYTSWSATKGGSNDPAYYNTGTGLRVYSGGTFGITSTKTIASITLTFSGTGYTFSTSNTTTPQTVTPNATSYSWDVSRTCRLQKIEVTYASGGGSTATALSVPTHLSSSNVTTTGATLSWDAVTNASSYTVKIGDTEHTGVTTTSYSATGLTAGTPYTWTVKAVGDGTNYSTSAYAANANFTTEAEQGGGDASSEKYDFSSFTQANDVELEAKNFKINLHKNTGSTAPQWNDKAGEARVYAVGSVDVVSTKNIVKIVYEYVTNAGGKNNVTPSISSVAGANNAGTWNAETKTWTGSDTKVTLTTSGSAGNLGFKSITVDFEPDVTKYDVKFYVGGEEQTGLAQKVVEGGYPTAVAEPTKTGYTFEGWYENSDFSGDKIADVTGVTIAADKNFYGRFNINNYTITYNNVDGATHSNPATYTIETATINLADASKDDFIFQGWFDNENFEGDAVTTIAQGSTGNKTFWAKWAEVPATPSVVTFYVGEHGTCKTASATEETVGAGVALPAVTANEGWVFKGWSTENPATAETIVSAGDDGMYHILANTSLYAFYKVKPVTPTFSSEAGAIEKGTEVTISCTTDGAAIYYTTNGDEPTAESAAYSEAIAVSEAKTIKAIAILDGEQSEVASAAYTIAQHTAQFSINGVITAANNCTVAKGEAITFPDDPTAPEEHVFIGWKKGGAEVTTPQADAIATVDKAAEVMGTENVIYYAVWAVGEAGGTTLSKLSSTAVFSAGDNIVVVATGTDWAKYMYQETVSTSYVAYKDFDGEVSTIAADAKNYFTLSAGSNGTWKLGDATKGYLYNASSNNLTVATGNSSDWTIAWDNSESKFSIKNGDRWLSCRSDLTGDNQYKFRGGGTSSASGTVYFDIYKYSNAGSTYSDYCTKVSLDPKPTIVLSATELAEYAGNTNTSITASVSEGEYTGALTVESSAEAVATASISEGTITINALTAGSATITVTAPEVTGFRKNTATIAVTVSNKLAHGLSFSADVLNLTVGDAEITEPTLSNPNSLPVVYSLVYAKPENEGKVATIDAETGKLTLAGLSTETQGAVTVKASTVGDNSHAAGEVTYNLVVARKVTTTSWSNEGAAVTIDKDEISTLPTASNNGERNLFYESSNTEVATIDNTGAVTFVAYGTTTITVKTEATSEYAATSASYKLTFAPRYTVTFKVYGKDDVVLREETTGAGVTAPAVNPINGKVFRGWAETEIDGTTDDAPTFITTATLDGDKTLHAVFAKKSAGADGSVDFTVSSISNLSTSNAERTQTTDGVTFTFSSVMDANVSGTHYVQMAKGSTLTQGAAFAGNIKSITFEGFGYSSTTNASMLVEGKKGNGEYATVQSCGSSYTGAEISFGSNEYDFFKITVGSERTVKFTKMTVAYSNVTYSGYCTTVKQLPTLSFAAPTYRAVMGAVFEAPELTKPDGITVEYSSSEIGVATVNASTGAVTLVAPGTTTITATSADNENYWESEASYQLIVAGKLSLVAVAGDSKYATFSSTSNVVIPAEDENATYNVYAIAVDDATMVPWDFVSDFNNVVDDNALVPANVGVVIKATPKAEKSLNDVTSLIYTCTNTAGDGYDAELNNLIAISANGTHVPEDDDNYYFKLAYRDNYNKTGLGFYKPTNDFTVKAGVAILGVAKSQFAPVPGSPIRGFDFSDWLNPSNPPITTDVEAVNKYVDTKKVLINSHLVVVRGGKVYDINGVLVK